MKRLLLISVFLFPFFVNGQDIIGKVLNESDEPLIGASIYCPKAQFGTFTDQEGGFELYLEEAYPLSIIISYVGYHSDTLILQNNDFFTVYLKPAAVLEEVVVSGQRAGVIISNLSSAKTEQLTQTELGKAACCDLAGCFETQSSVQPQTTNVITNSKELRILGLSGVYNQVLIDGFPMIQGLSYTYGISSIPGTLVDNIFISKGANSVVQGFESISGQINVETKEPDQTEDLYLNVYVNSFLEKQFNTNYAVSKGKWSNLLTFHSVQPARAVDRDEDGFLDLPKLKRYMVSNKLKYGDDSKWGWNSKIGLRYLDEQRVGGQLSFNTETDKGSDQVYGQVVEIQQPEIWTRSGLKLNDQHNIILFASALYQKQNSFFGTVNYTASQSSVYGNLQYEFTYKENILKSGLSYRYLELDENIVFTSNLINRTYAGNYLKQENIGGLFAENTLRLFDGKLTWVAGIRLDNHNTFGAQLTPRTLLKYDLSEQAVLRANIGKGWRTVNLFSEHIGLLISSRDIVFAEELRPEEALNMGVNFTQKFNGSRVSGFFSADFYHTDFQNQIFPDYNEQTGLAVVSNFDGKSVSNTFQAELYLNFKEQFEFKTGYTYLDVYRIKDGAKDLLPFNSRHKVVSTFSFTPLSKKFHFDMNLHVHGPQRLPDTQENPEVYRRGDFSEVYSTVNAQFTHSLERWEWYFGCENILDFRQRRPILSWQDPFGPYFDTSSVWGPTRGREFYLGIRYKLAK
jgi:outer membrane receptor for ferrienterochelin and colicins